MVAEDRPSSGGFAKCKPLAFSKASVARHFGRTSRDSGGGRRRGGGRLELFKRAHRNDTGENKGRRGSCGVGTAAAPRRPHCKIWLLNLKCDKMLRQPLRSGVWLNRLWAVLVINPSSLCLCVSAGSGNKSGLQRQSLGVRQRGKSHETFRARDTNFLHQWTSDSRKSIVPDFLCCETGQNQWGPEEMWTRAFDRWGPIVRYKSVFRLV